MTEVMGFEVTAWHVLGFIIVLVGLIFVGKAYNISPEDFLNAIIAPVLSVVPGGFSIPMPY